MVQIEEITSAKREENCIESTKEITAYKLYQLKELSEDVFLAVYEQDGQKKPEFILKGSSQANRFVIPDSERGPTIDVEFTVDTRVWQMFRFICCKLEILPEDCFNAWARFMIKPESTNVVEKLFGIRKR